ncbi:MAG: G5 domain-containing protein [Clostridia bacterium]|nr:G5 domain-containing protein [Clostridia bacterium]
MKKEKMDGKIIIKISILWLFALVIIASLSIAFFKNDIFATNDYKNENKQISEIEPNENTVDILQLMVSNNYSNKKLVNEERDIEFITEKINDNQIPKGEEKIEQKGVLGKKQVKALQQFENDKFISEDIIESVTVKEPVKEIIHVGTSEFLAKFKVHIGEEMFLMEKTDLKKEANDSSESITTINRYLNFEVLEVSENWTKVKYKENEGYLPNEKLTSETITPKIKEKNRIARIKDSLKKDMDLTEPTGLTLSDYKTMLGYNKSDKNSIFADNMEYFYNAEQKYGVNGIFIAAIGIHESGWGTSYLAKEKKNLFGYKAYDRDPINSAQDFESYEDAINTVAQALSKNYLTPSGSFYYGKTMEAVNTKYASDSGWHEKVYSYMEYLYDKLE